MQLENSKILNEKNKKPITGSVNKLKNLNNMKKNFENEKNLNGKFIKMKKILFLNKQCY